MLDQFTELPIPMPPMLPEALGYRGTVRYFSLSYSWSKAWLSDGQQCHETKWRIYLQLVDHIALQVHLLHFNLGSDEECDTHRIICDRTLGKMYVGESGAVVDFLRQQHPPKPVIKLTPEQILELQEKVDKLLAQKPEPIDIEAMIDAEIRWIEELQNWLDQYITLELVQQYIESDHDRAPWIVVKLKARLERE